MKSWFLLGGMFALVALAGCQTTATTAGKKNTAHTFTTVVVDAGHGGKDSGALRRSGPPEKSVTLDVAKRLERKLRESEFKIVMTRSDDRFIPLDTRVDIGNRTGNSLFVSIHFNDARRSGVRGFETYYHSPYALPIAQRIQQKLLSIPNSANRGIHVANYRVLRNAAYPSILVECGFLSNRREGREARTDEYRELLADKIAEAIVEERYGPGSYRARDATATTRTDSRVPAPPGEGPEPYPTPLGRDKYGPGLVPSKLGPQP